jgi:hypothetical protein
MVEIWMLVLTYLLLRWCRVDATAGVLPAGYIGIVASNTPGAFSTYSYTYVPTYSGASFVLFAFRQVRCIIHSFLACAFINAWNITAVDVVTLSPIDWTVLLA